jgi:hypothetical protein
MRNRDLLALYPFTDVRSSAAQSSLAGTQDEKGKRVTFTVPSAAEIEATEAAIWYDDRKAGLGTRFLDAFEEVLDRIRAGYTAQFSKIVATPWPWPTQRVARPYFAPVSRIR